MQENSFNIFGLRNPKRVLLHTLIDGLLLAGCFIASLILAKNEPSFTRDIVLLLSLAIITTLGALLYLGFYKIVVTYITGRAAIPASIALLVACSVSYLLSVMIGARVGLSEFVMFGLLSLFGILGIRFTYRHIKMPNASKLGSKKVIIYGAGSAGRQLVNGLGLTKEFSPVAFIDDNRELHGCSVGGLVVFDSAEAPKLIKRFAVDLVVLAMPSINSERRREIVLDFVSSPVAVRIIPGFEELMASDKHISDLRNISIYDLLGRNPAPAKPHLLEKTIRDQVVAVTGAGGSIGSELCRKIIASNPKSLLLIDNSEFSLYTVHEELKRKIKTNGSNITLVPILGSVQDYPKMKSIMSEFSVDTLFHSAAYKHVPLVETNIVEGVKNNVFGTLAVARAAVECNVGVFTLISTDKAVRPTNIMGASKRLAEFVCSYMMDQGEATVFSMVRFGNVLGSSGSVVPLFERQIRNGGPVTVTHPEVTRFFMTIPEAAELVIQAAALARGKEVFLLDMGHPIKIVEMAKEMIRLSDKLPFFPSSPNSDTPENHIPILFTGLRPGEKLFEELLVNNESKKTEHPLIMSAIENGPLNSDFEKILERLREACESPNEHEIRDIMIQAGTGLNSQEPSKS